MDRRGFLSGILAAAVAPAIVRAESLMVVRPLASAGWAIAAGDTLLTPRMTIDVITREALRVLENNLVMSRMVNRRFDDDFFSGNSLIVKGYPK